MSIPKYILPIIVISQFCCTSLWFAGNAVITDLVLNFNLQESALGHLTSSVQFGFITGTLLFAILTLADRFSPSRVFFICSLFGAIFNLGIVLDSNNLTSLLFLRFFTGFFLAGIYPVGMKIAADYYDKGLGKSLGYLVGALVLGTALPHLLKDITAAYPWRYVLVITSSLATIGGLSMFTIVPDGPNRKPIKKTSLLAFTDVFRNREFRSVAFGYFGHMWELYAFWAFVPLMLIKYSEIHTDVDFNIPLLSFLIIAVGSLSCVFAGYVSKRVGVRRTALIALFLSGVCCFVFPLIFAYGNQILFIGFLLFWGMVVIADSPLLSTLVAQNVPAEIKGTALTIVNCIGFSITIFSIQILTVLTQITESNTVFTILAIGPVIGFVALVKSKR